MRSPAAKRQLGLFVLLWLAGGPVAAQSLQEHLAELNRLAMEVYQNLEIDRAEQLLQQALDLARQQGIEGPVRARTHLNLAVVYLNGAGDEELALDQFIRGICADPAALPDPLLSTPSVKEAFARAAVTVQQNGCPPNGRRRQADRFQRKDGECPPDIKCNNEQSTPPQKRQCLIDEDCPRDRICRWGECRQRKTSTPPEPSAQPPRFFLQLGPVLALPYVTAGMSADSGPPAEAPPFVRDAEGNPVDYNRNSPWVPDSDSFGPGGPLGGDCPADGIQTGFGEEPSRYCVRVVSPGFVPGFALRAAVGYFILPRFSIAALMRLQLTAGRGDLAGVLIGARGEYMIIGTPGRGFSLSLFGGGSAGQIQAKPTVERTQIDPPFVISGLAGAHAGMSLRYRIGKTFGLFASPELDIQFPSYLLNIDLTLAGVEAAF